MAMRESVRSIRVYFIVIACFYGFRGIFAFAGSPVLVIDAIIGFIGIAFGIAYLYIGIRLKQLLIESPKVINSVILLSMGVLVVSFLLGVLSGMQASTGGPLIVGLLVTWYLLKNVKRLSSEERSKEPIAVTDQQ